MTLWGRGFSCGSFPQRGPKDLAESYLSKVIQATAECIIVDIVWFNPW